MKTLCCPPFIFTLFGMFVCGGLIAQANAVSGGGNVDSPSGSVSYTIGQATANIINPPGPTIYEGVQQPYELFVVSIFMDTDQGLSAEIFPNPTSTDLILRILSRELSSTTRYTITDVNGVTMTSQVFAEDEIIIPMADYSPGTYVLTLFHHVMPVHQFKIIKL